MLQYLTPTTLKAAYQDLDEARLDLLPSVNEDNLIEKTAIYREITVMLEEIDKQYEAVTGEALSVEVAVSVEEK